MIQDYGKAVQSIRKHATEYFHRYNLKSIVLGMSGGIDSALCAALLQPVCDDLKMKFIGRSYPIHTNKKDERDRAIQCGKAFCTDFKEIDLGNRYAELEAHMLAGEYSDKADDRKNAILRGNRKARLRMIHLYDLAGLNDGLVISTENYTEMLLGFWTLNGDVGDYSPIQMLWKTEVYKMTEYLAACTKTKSEVDALLSCVEAIPTDGLGITNSDLDQIMPNWEKTYKTTREAYEAVDQILLSRDSYDITHPVIKRHITTQFKRDNPIIIPRHLLSDDLFGFPFYDQ